MSRCPHQRPGFPWRIPLLATLLLLAAWPANAQADPVQTVLIDPGDTAAPPFLSELTTWWRFRDIPSSDRLAFRAVAGERRRMLEVDRGRGAFALVTAGAVARYREELPRIAVVAVLWPNYLHVLTRNPELTALKLPLSAPLRILPGAQYVQDTLQALLRPPAGSAPGVPATPATAPTPGVAAAPQTPSVAAPQTPSVAAPQTPSVAAPQTPSVAAPGLQNAAAPPPDWMAPHTPGILSSVGSDILLLSAPVPDAAVIDAAAHGTAPLRLLPLAPELLNELKLSHPWLVVGGLKSNVYPFLKTGLEVPVAYAVLVARRDLGEPSVRKMLQGLYDYRQQAADVNPMFAQIDKASLSLFNGVLPLHPVTRAAYNLPLPPGTPAAPRGAAAIVPRASPLAIAPGAGAGGAPAPLRKPS